MPFDQDLADRIVEAHLPRGWTLCQWDREDGLADFSRRLICCPVVVNKDALGYFLHECGHALFAHRAADNTPHLPRHVEEYQAETYSWYTLRAWGMEPSRHYKWNSRVYVGEMILEDEALGRHIVPAIRKWAIFE